MIAAAALLAYAALYAAGVRRVRRWPASRTACFAAGLGLVAVALLAPLDERLSGHMAQHLILGVAAPLCLAAGAPVRLALGALRHPRPPARAPHAPPGTPPPRRLAVPPLPPRTP